MILEIKKYPDPVLREECREAKKITEEIKNLSWDMVETMEKGQGIGLAAPQVGKSERIIIVMLKEGPRIFINPEIIKRTKETEVMEEGCLSFPGLFLEIKRAKAVEIEALNDKGEKVQIKANGLPARIFQHEIDHLRGILFIDRISKLKKLKLKLLGKI